MGARDDTDGGKATSGSIAHCTNDDIFRSLFDKDSGNAAHNALRKRKRGEKVTAWDSLYAALWKAGSGQGPAAEVEKMAALKRVLEYWTHTHMRYMHRVIGVALSKARPGRVWRKSYHRRRPRHC